MKVRRIAIMVLCGLFLVPYVVTAQSMEWLQEHLGTSTVHVVPPADSVVPSNDGLEVRVREYFSAVPVMGEIARCESGFRQFDKKGNPLDGGSGSMMGLFQINATVHAKYAKSIGININTIEGNLAYAKKLYDEEGTDPWLSSFACWHSTNSIPTQLQSVSTAPVISGAKNSAQVTRDLFLGVISPEVKTLQKLLNANGYKLATDGPGSAGQETEKFGTLTRNALRAFQCARNISCAGDEHTTGFGMTGVQTRDVLTRLSLSVPESESTNTSTSEDAQIAALQTQIAQLSVQLYALRQKIAMQ